MNEHDPFVIYVRTYGKIASGTKLVNVDYGVVGYEGWVAYPAEGQTAISLAAQDVKIGKPMRSKVEFESELRRMLGDQ